MKGSSGFTLIELLVVMLIIGITAGVAVISLSPSNKSLPATTATGLARELRFASLLAMLKPATLGFVLTQCGWQFEIFESTGKQPAKWHPLHERALPATCLNASLGIRLDTPGHRIIMTESGDRSPFDILIYQKGKAHGARITGTASGDIKVSAAHGS